MEDKINKKGLNSFTLKIIAIVTMAVDHIGAVFFPDILFLRFIGRIAFPIFCFLLVEGFFYTHDVKKYMMRLGIFALVSEVPFDLAFFHTPIELSHQNVFITLLLGMVVLYILNTKVHVVIKIVGVIGIIFLAEIIRSDYGAAGILMVLLFYVFRSQFVAKFLSVGLLNIVMGMVQVFAILSFIPIYLYNGKRGPKVKYLFYLFYPLHLLVIAIIKILLYR